MGEVQLLHTRASGTSPLEGEVIVIESTRDVPCISPNKGRSESASSIADFWPHGLGVALARSITLIVILVLLYNIISILDVYKGDGRVYLRYIVNRLYLLSRINCT